MLRTNGEDHVNHMFSDGVPEQGKQATVIDAEWLNAVQEEIAQFIELAGLTLDGAIRTSFAMLCWQCLWRVFRSAETV